MMIESSQKYIRREVKEMELRKASGMDWVRIFNAMCHKDEIPFCTPTQVLYDFQNNREYIVVEGEKILATVSLVEEPQYGYTAIKRLCILNKKNQGKGIARFAIHEIQKMVKGKIGGTPWIDNAPVCHLFESEGTNVKNIKCV